MVSEKRRGVGSKPSTKTNGKTDERGQTRNSQIDKACGREGVDRDCRDAVARQDQGSGARGDRARGDADDVEGSAVQKRVGWTGEGNAAPGKRRRAGNAAGRPPAVWCSV